MKNIFKAIANIYKFLLITIIAFSLIAKFIVGVAGHNSEFKITDYLFFGYITITLTLLIIVQKDKNRELLKTTLRSILIILIAAILTYLSYELYEIYLLYSNVNFQSYDNILIGIIILLIILNTTLFIGLIKNEI